MRKRFICIALMCCTFWVTPVQAAELDLVECYLAGKECSVRLDECIDLPALLRSNGSAVDLGKRKDCMTVSVKPCVITSNGRIERYWSVSLESRNYGSKKEMSAYRKWLKKTTKRIVKSDPVHDVYEYVKSVCRVPKEGERISRVSSISNERIFECAQYSLLFRDLLDAASIPCIVVDGFSSAGVSHSWNLVKDRDTWYFVDVTWDDSKSAEEYFMVGAEKLRIDHTIAPAFEESLKQYRIAK